MGAEKNATFTYVTCKFCNKFCFSEQEITLHEATHTTNKKLYCRLCGMGFARRSYLAEHMIVHNGIQPHKCPHCQMLFTLRCNLVRHIRIHTGERPYKCEYCPFTFTLKKNMQEHIRVHTGERPYECSHCEARFARRSSLVRHARTHTNERFFTCHDCDKTFQWKHYLGRHITNCHLKKKHPRKRRTKAELAAAKAARASQLMPIIALPKIKIEENEKEICQVFVPIDKSTDGYCFEDTDGIKEEWRKEDESSNPCSVFVPEVTIQMSPEHTKRRTSHALQLEGDELSRSLYLPEVLLHRLEDIVPVRTTPSKGVTPQRHEAVTEMVVEVEQVEVKTEPLEILNPLEEETSNVIILDDGRKITHDDYLATTKKSLIVDLPRVPSS